MTKENIPNVPLIGRAKAEKVENILKDRIHTEELAIGARITASQITKEFGLDSSWAGFVLASLRSNGLAQRGAHRGTYVSPPAPKEPPKKNLPYGKCWDMTN